VRTEIIKRAGVVIALGSLWFSYSITFQVLSIIGMVIIALSCVALGFRERLLQSRWKRLAEISAGLDVTFAGLALTMVLAGSRLVIDGSEAHSLAGIIAGLLVISAGVFFLGGAFGQAISKIILQLYHPKPKTKKLKG
jgi:hypothetical protein